MTMTVSAVMIISATATTTPAMISVVLSDSAHVEATLSGHVEATLSASQTSDAAVGKN